jgi:hypothetical protein
MPSIKLLGDVMLSVTFFVMLSVQLGRRGEVFASAPLAVQGQMGLLCYCSNAQGAKES